MRSRGEVVLLKKENADKGKKKTPHSQMSYILSSAVSKRL